MQSPRWEQKKPKRLVPLGQFMKDVNLRRNISINSQKTIPKALVKLDKSFDYNGQYIKLVGQTKPPVRLRPINSTELK
jgi:hypothetical protein